MESGGEELTPQEKQILSLIATGLNNVAIGSQLTIEHNTVRSHVLSIYKKLGYSRESACNPRIAAVLHYLKYDTLRLTVGELQARCRELEAENARLVDVLAADGLAMKGDW